MKGAVIVYFPEILLYVISDMSTRAPFNTEMTKKSQMRQNIVICARQKPNMKQFFSTVL